MTSSSSAPFGEATDAKYVKLTTFRKDGTLVSSPLWAAFDDGKLLMFTPADSWKVKRLRRDNRVVVQACDRSGAKVWGEPINATAEVLEGETAGADHARSVIIKKYPLLGWLIVKGSQVRRGKKGTVGLAVTADRPHS